MAARDEFWTLITAVIDHRFMKASESRAGIGADVFDPKRLDDIDHEIGTGAIDSENFHARRGAEFGLWRDWSYGTAKRTSGRLGFS